MQRQLMQNIAPAKNLLNTIRNSANPQAMLQQMMLQNPQISNVIKYINDNGGDAREVFYKTAQEQGINPQEIINVLSQ